MEVAQRHSSLAVDILRIQLPVNRVPSRLQSILHPWVDGGGLRANP